MQDPAVVVALVGVVVAVVINMILVSYNYGRLNTQVRHLQELVDSTRKENDTLSAAVAGLSQQVALLAQEVKFLRAQVQLPRPGGGDG